MMIQLSSYLKNGQIVQDVLSYTKEEEDGYKVIILNPGNAGDTVRVTVTWQLSNILFLYNDIAELNWQPLTDSSGDIKDLEFRVTSDSPAEKLFSILANSSTREVSKKSMISTGLK